MSRLSREGKQSRYGRLSTVYTRARYDFEQQTIDPLDLRLSPGSVGRLTCSDDNDRNETISYGQRR